MSSIYFLQLSLPQTGLCNQLNSLLATICYCVNNEKIIVIDKFLKEINTNNYAPIAEILNLEKTNQFLEKYNIALVDGNFTDNLNIITAKYGCNDIFTDVTSVVKSFLTNNKLIIKKEIDLNSIFGDCHVNKAKILKIDFMLNNHNRFTMSFSEKNNFLTKDIDIDFSNKNYTMIPSWEPIDTPQHINMTTDIYKNLTFHDVLIIHSNQFIQKTGITGSSIVNIIHLRLEDDAISFWSYQNKLTKEDFKKRLSEKYIHLINTLIDKKDKTIILTYDTNNTVINFLKDNNYNYFIHDKIKNNNREVNAIIDIINSKYCNNVFISVCGSTFSWTIAKLIQPKLIEWIDINNINN